MDPNLAGRILLVIGIIIAGAGVFLMLGGRLPLGRLPGDISLGSGNVSFSFPIVTCILLSIVLTIVINIFLR